MAEIKIRIALVVGSDGNWQASGYRHFEGDNNMKWDEAMETYGLFPDERRFWIEATVPAGGIPVVSGEVKEDDTR